MQVGIIGSGNQARMELESLAAVYSVTAASVWSPTVANREKFARDMSKKLGIKVNYKVIDFAILQKRMDVFDFEVISNRVGGSEAPGTELLERFGSKAADTEGSSNVMGVKDPAVDALLDQVVAAQTRPQLVTALKALDRVLRHGHYAVPHWYGSVHRVAWRAGRFEQPSKLPRYYQPDAWVTATWWGSVANLSGP